MQDLKPCPFRQVDGDGNILCDKIKSGDRAVSPAICRACPIAAIQCSHLRATLMQQAHPPVVVRYGNGRTEVWDDPAPPIELERAACAEKVIPIHSPRDCAGCPLRLPLMMPTAVEQPPTADRRPTIKDRRSVAGSAKGRPAKPPLPVTGQPSTVAVPMAEQARSQIVAKKIIQLQEWLEKSKHTSHEQDSDEVRPIAVGMSRAQTAPRREEKSVGWTD